MTTTISEQAILYGVDVDSVRWQLQKNKIEPIEKKKWVLNGYIVRPYLVEDVIKAMCGFNPEKVIANRVTVNKHYSQKEICQVLRNDVKNNLNNKLIRHWNYKDWQEFEKIRTSYPHSCG